MISEEGLIKWEDSAEPEWFGTIDIEELERLAGVGFTPAQIAKYYNIKESEFLYHYMLVGSPLKYHYERGQLIQIAMEGKSMADASRTGSNTTQAQRFDKLRGELGYKNSINKIFFDDLP